MDKFYTQENCDRCGGSLEDGRIMSMYNTDCICLHCKREEKKRSDYRKALKAEIRAVQNGELNYPGIGYGREA